MNSNKISVDALIKHCEEKYDDKFSLVSMENELWTADYSDIILSSEALNGAEINVRAYSEERILDNYVAVKYKSSVEEKVESIAKEIYGDVKVVNIPISYGVDFLNKPLTFDEYVGSYESKVFVAIATNDSVAQKDKNIESLRVAFENEKICANVAISYYSIKSIEDIQLSVGTGKVFKQIPVIKGFMNLNPDFSVSSLSWSEFNEQY